MRGGFHGQSSVFSPTQQRGVETGRGGRAFDAIVGLLSGGAFRTGEPAAMGQGLRTGHDEIQEPPVDAA